MKKNTNKEFNIEHSHLLKGVAVLCLFLHHILSPSYTYQTVLIPQHILNHLVSIGKVCVPIFFILSSYGMYTSFWKQEQHSLQNDLCFVSKHIVKLLLSFWIIYLTFVPISLLFDYSFIEKYSSSGILAVNLITDLFGCAALFSTPSMNNTWWYLGVSLVFYMVSPVLFRLIKKCSYYIFVIFIITVIVTSNYYGLRGLVIYFIPYFLGAICAEKKVFSKMSSYNVKYEWIKILIMIVISILVIFIRQYILAEDIKYYKFDWILALVIIYLFHNYISTTSTIGKSLIALGKESGNLFFIHSFFYAVWLKAPIYNTLKYSILIYVTFLVICFYTSVLIEYIKEKCRYNRLINYIITSSKLSVIFFIICLLLVSATRIPYALAPHTVTDVTIATQQAPITIGNSRRIVLQYDALLPEYTSTKWVSSDTTVVTVSSDGVITAINVGTAKVTASIGSKSVSYNVTVLSQ